MNIPCTEARIAASRINGALSRRPVAEEGTAIFSRNTPPGRAILLPRVVSKWREMRICAMHNSQHLDQIGSPPVASPDAVRLAMASHPCVASNDTHNPDRRSSTAGYRSCRREPIALKKKARQKDL